MVATKVSRFMKIARFVSLQFRHTVIPMRSLRNQRAFGDLMSPEVSARFPHGFPRGFPEVSWVCRAAISG
jgi:hypothetical protein